MREKLIAAIMKLTGARERNLDKLCEFSDRHLQKLQKVIKIL